MEDVEGQTLETAVFLEVAPSPLLPFDDFWFLNQKLPPSEFSLGRLRVRIVVFDTTSSRIIDNRVPLAFANARAL